MKPAAPVTRILAIATLPSSNPLADLAALFLHLLPVLLGCRWQTQELPSPVFDTGHGQTVRTQPKPDVVQESATADANNRVHYCLHRIPRPVSPSAMCG